MDLEQLAKANDTIKLSGDEGMVALTKDGQLIQMDDHYGEGGGGFFYDELPIDTPENLDKSLGYARSVLNGARARIVRELAILHRELQDCVIFEEKLRAMSNQLRGCSGRPRRS